jgi:hypothetical protein
MLCLGGESNSGPVMVPIHCPEVQLMHKNIKISKYQNIKISKYQNIKISKYQNIKISKYQNIKISKCELRDDRQRVIF